MCVADQLRNRDTLCHYLASYKKWHNVTLFSYDKSFFSYETCVIVTSVAPRRPDHKEAILALNTATAEGAMTGPRYLRSLNDGREVWLDGQRVHDVPNHPAFTGVVHELARIYDLQHSPEYRDRMTFTSPETGNPCSLSWLLPRSIDDLKRKRVNSELWNQECWGQFGRSPDILAPYIITLYDARDALSALKHPKCDFGQNAVNYYRYCAENDLFLTHALATPKSTAASNPRTSNA